MMWLKKQAFPKIMYYALRKVLLATKKFARVLRAMQYVKRNWILPLRVRVTNASTRNNWIPSLPVENDEAGR